MAKRFLPAAGSLLYLSWTMLIAPSCSQNAPAQTCDPGWFGSNCQYKCRYLSWIFDRNTTCAYSDCQAGWFGPGCQYVDLSYNQFTLNLRSWHYDKDGGLTCEQKNELKQLTVNMPSKFAFTWLRLQVSDPSLLHEIQVTFSDNINNNTLACENARNATVNKNTLDIHCDLDVIVQSVVLTGNGVKSLCSLHVSGGRNVALRQNATQSSNYTDRPIDYSIATNAVDGNTDNYFYNRSCTCTFFGDRNPNWSVRLSSANYINRYVVYNRVDSNDRLLGFTLTSFTKDNEMLFNFTDRNIHSHTMYTITNGLKSPPVSVVNIRANNTVPQPVLTLCEVELYGDTACPPSKYGRECEHTCNCAVKDESCFVSTGGCPSGCAAGFQGESCDKSCDFGEYGLGCSSNCSQFCVPTHSSRSPCFPTNGTCVHGCVSSYQTPKCEPISLSMDEDSIPAVAVVLPLIAAVILIVVVVLGVILRRRRRSTSHTQSPNVVSGDDSHYDKIDNTEMNKTIASTGNEYKSNQPVNCPTTSKHITQSTSIPNNPIVNDPKSDDSLHYEVPVNTKLNPTSTPEINEPKHKPQAICATTPKQPKPDIETQPNSNDNIYCNTELK